MILNGNIPFHNLCEPKPDTIIWRYINFPKFIHLITYSQLYFSRLDKLPDKLEGVIPKNIIDGITDRYNSKEDFYMSPGEVKLRSIQDKNHMEKYNKYTLVNCWSKNVDESFALWKIYLGCQPYGVAIKTTYDKLKRSLMHNNFKIVLQEVYYDKKAKGENQTCIFFRKDKYYFFENEIRAIIFNQYKTFGGEPIYEDGVEVDVDIVELIDQIYVSPMAPAWYHSLLEHLIKHKYGYNFKLVKSEIREYL